MLSMIFNPWLLKQALGELAAKYGVCLHVDLCLGGFVLPFARKLGYVLQDTSSTTDFSSDNIVFSIYYYQVQFY